MVNAKRDSDAGAGGQLRRLAATLPSADQALDELIARAHRTEVAVGDEAVVEETLVDDPAPEPATDPYLARRSEEALASDPTAPDHLNAYLAVPPDDETTDAELLITARTQDERTTAAARERALQKEIATFVQKLDDADARGRAQKRRTGLIVVAAFAAGVVVMIGVSTWLDRGARDEVRPRAELPRAELPPPTVTPIEAPPPSPAAAVPVESAAAPVEAAAAPVDTAIIMPAVPAAPAKRHAAPTAAPVTAPAAKPARKPAELADPFADPADAKPAETAKPAGADAKPAEAKPAALVNPF